MSTRMESASERITDKQNQVEYAEGSVSQKDGEGARVTSRPCKLTFHRQVPERHCEDDWRNRGDPCGLRRAVSTTPRDRGGLSDIDAESCVVGR